MGKTWHPEHFVCTHCQEEIGSRNFFERDGQPYCEKDYHNLFSPRCYYCNGPILDVSSQAWWRWAHSSSFQLHCHLGGYRLCHLRLKEVTSQAQAHAARKRWGWDSDPPMHILQPISLPPPILIPFLRDSQGLGVPVPSHVREMPSLFEPKFLHLVIIEPMTLTTCED